MNQRKTFYITCVFLCLLTPECCSREAMAAATSGVKGSGVVFITEASYYTNIETHGRKCADGKYHNLNTELVAANWDFPFKSVLRVCNIKTGKSILVSVVDRGPAKRLYNKGRRIDLSAAAFKELAGGRLDCGILQVVVTKIN